MKWKQCWRQIRRFSNPPCPFLPEIIWLMSRCGKPWNVLTTLGKQDTTNIKTQIPQTSCHKNPTQPQNVRQKNTELWSNEIKNKKTNFWMNFHNATKWDSSKTTQTLMAKQAACYQKIDNQAPLPLRLFQKPGKEFVVFLWDSVALFRVSRCVLDCLSRLQCVDCYGDHILVWWNKGAGYIDL